MSFSLGRNSRYTTASLLIWVSWVAVSVIVLWLVSQKKYRLRGERWLVYAQILVLISLALIQVETNLRLWQKPPLINEQHEQALTDYFISRNPATLTVGQSPLYPGILKEDGLIYPTKTTLTRLDLLIDRRLLLFAQDFWQYPFPLPFNDGETQARTFNGDVYSGFVQAEQRFFIPTGFDRVSFKSEMIASDAQPFEISLMSEDQRVLAHQRVIFEPTSALTPIPFEMRLDDYQGQFVVLILQLGGDGLWLNPQIEMAE